MKIPSPHEITALLLPFSHVQNTIPYKKAVPAITNSHLQILLLGYHVARLVHVGPNYTTQPVTNRNRVKNFLLVYHISIMPMPVVCKGIHYIKSHFTAVFKTVTEYS
jgi:hypothetical protein